MANPQHISIGGSGLERHQTVGPTRKQRGIEGIQTEIHAGSIQRRDRSHGRNEVVLVVEVASLHAEEPIGARAARVQDTHLAHFSRLGDGTPKPTHCFWMCRRDTNPRVVLGYHWLYLGPGAGVFLQERHRLRA
jgi:hypothetical protein